MPPRAPCAPTDHARASGEQRLWVRGAPRPSAACSRVIHKTLPELEYPDALQLRRVSDVGVISWAGRRVFISNVLRGEVVGVNRIDDATSDVFFGPVLLGSLRDDNLTLGLVRKREEAE